MCGRYALYGPTSRLREQFDLDLGFDFAPRYNIAPGTEVLVVESAAPGGRSARLLRWGLIPSWAQDASIGARLINARGETVSEKPAFRAAFRRARCIVPANGFYEWTAHCAGGRMVRQPYFIRPRAAGDLFAFAGLCERWRSPAGEEIRTCCIITTSANALVLPIHQRMPVILGATEHAAWLDPDNRDVEGLRTLLRPAVADGMLAHPVCRAVNSSRAESAALIEAV